MQFNIDLNRLQKSYRIIQAEIHPDKFISASEIEKKQSLIKSTEVNDAYQTLKNPIKRAKYLIKINLKSKQKDSTLPPNFLMKQMEWEEYLESIWNQKEELEKFKLLISTEYQKILNALENACDKNKNWNDAMQIINEIQFIDKLNHKIIKQINEIETK
jgi:molecular chaperone HscB